MIISQHHIPLLLLLWEEEWSKHVENFIIYDLFLFTMLLWIEQCRGVLCERVREIGLKTHFLSSQNTPQVCKKALEDELQQCSNDSLLTRSLLDFNLIHPPSSPALECVHSASLNEMRARKRENEHNVYETKIQGTLSPPTLNTCRKIIEQKKGSKWKFSRGS